jgi:hypothetical protein
MLERIKPVYFVISFCIGILLVYVITPKKSIIYKFPSPDNSDLVYHDKSDTCYKYHNKEMSCNDVSEEMEIEPQPIIEDFKLVNNI